MVKTKLLIRFYINNDAIFSVVSSANPIDQSVSGANLVWNFNDLTSIGQSQYTNTTPTPDEVSTFPNTNAVIGSTDGAGTTTSQLFTKNGLFSSYRISNGERFKTTSSDLTCPKSGIRVMSMVKLSLIPYFKSIPILKSFPQPLPV